MDFADDLLGRASVAKRLAFENFAARKDFHALKARASTAASERVT